MSEPTEIQAEEIKDKPRRKFGKQSTFIFISLIFLFTLSFTYFNYPWIRNIKTLFLKVADKEISRKENEKSDFEEWLEEKCKPDSALTPVGYCKETKE